MLRSHLTWREDVVSVPEVIYHHPDGRTDVVEVATGQNVMRAAINNDVPNIVGECGGNMMCATCHVYVCEAFLDDLPEMAEQEDEMLVMTAQPRDESRSRLSCQLVLGDGLPSIEVQTPSSQV